MQKELRAKGMRKLYALGMQMTTVGPNDGNGLFSHFMIANGGEDIVTQDGKLHTDDPQVREAAISSVAYMTNAYKEGYVPPEALSWNDADDNNAYHEKLIVMDLDGTLSTELAMIKDKKAYYEDMVTWACRTAMTASRCPAQVGAGGGFIPKGARERRGRQGLHEVLHAAPGDEREPEGRTGSLGAGDTVAGARPIRGGAISSEDPHRSPYVQEAVLGPTIPAYNGYNPAWGQVSAEQLWGVAHADVIKQGNDAGRGGGQGVPAGGGDIREIYFRVRACRT